MNQGTPTPPQHVFVRSTGKFQETPIDEINGAVRQSAPSVCGNRIDDEAEAIFAALQSGVEVSQAEGGIVEDLPEVGEFFLAGYRHSLLKVAARQRLGTPHQAGQRL